MSGDMKISKEIASIKTLQDLRNKTDEWIQMLPKEKKEKAKVIHALSRQAIRLAKAEANEHPAEAKEYLSAIDKRITQCEPTSKFMTVVRRIFGPPRTRAIRQLDKKILAKEKQRVKLWNQLVKIGKDFGLPLDSPYYKQYPDSALNALNQKLSRMQESESLSKARKASKGLALLAKYNQISSNNT